jgi:hypothetical protein
VGAGAIAAEASGVVAVAAVTAVVGSIEMCVVAWLALKAGRRTAGATP